MAKNHVVTRTLFARSPLPQAGIHSMLLANAIDGVIGSHDQLVVRHGH